MNIVKSSIVSVLLLVGVGGFGHSALAAPDAGSSNVDITCGSFNNDQAAAQTYFEANGHPANLDQNGDGLACAEPDDGDFTSTGPSAGSYDVSITCASFNNDRSAAQTYFDATDKPGNLDQDGDGVACNDAATVDDAPTASASEVEVNAFPNTGSGSSNSITHHNLDDTSLAIAAGLALLAAVGLRSISTRRR